MAIRMGFYTGKLYDNSFDPEDIHECCRVLNWKDPILNDEKLVVSKRLELKKLCEQCSYHEDCRQRLERMGVICQ